jgi:hypothetical protein
MEDSVGLNLSFLLLTQPLRMSLFMGIYGFPIHQASKQASVTIPETRSTAFISPFQI